MFILILFLFLALTGYVMSRMDRENIMKNWTERRCDLTVMLAARFSTLRATPEHLPHFLPIILTFVSRKCPRRS